MIIGITGKSGSGKSYLSEILAKELDFIHIDIDKISHEVLELEKTKQFLLKEFGSSIFKNNKLDRKILGKIVFNNSNKLEKLNKFCQTAMENKLDEIIKTSKKSLVLDYALLCGLKQFNKCDIKILLKTDLDIRFSRVTARENISKEYFIARDNSLEDFNESLFDFVYNNISNTDINQLTQQIKSNFI